MPSLTSIAEEVLAKAREIDRYLESNGLAAPSYDNDVLADLPGDLENVRYSLVNSSNELKKLAQGLAVLGKELSTGWTDTLTLRVIYHYQIAKAIPINSSASYDEIASTTGLSESLVFRFIRAAMSHNIFDQESSTGRVYHTSLSRLLACDDGFVDSIGLQVDDLGPASIAYIDALQRWGVHDREPNQTAFALHNRTNEHLFDFLSQHPERARRFASAMQWFTADESWDLRLILRAYDWSSLDRPGTHVVDIGGSNGHVSMYLARNTSNMRFTVQDLPHVVATAEKALHSDFKGRVTLRPHDFTTPQVERDIDVFFLRWVLHDWPETYCIRILRHLTPALRDGSKILIYEYVLDDEPVKDLAGKVGLTLDIIMAACFNGQERTKQGFRRLLEKSDPRFVLEGFRRPEGSTQSLVEVTWRP